MERRDRDLEREPDQRHHDSGGEQRLDGRCTEGLRDRGQSGRSRQAVDQADSEKREGARHAAEEKIFQPGFSRPEVAPIERGHDVKREPGQLESDENHEQLFAPDEEEQPDRREQNEREIFAVMARRVVVASEEHGEKREHEADDLEEGIERRDHEHAVKEDGVRRQVQNGHRRGRETESSDERERGHHLWTLRQAERQDDKRRHHHDRFGRG